MTAHPNLSGRSVLYLEDEVVVAMEVSEMLRGMGFGRVRVAHTLEAAEQVSQDDPVDLAVLDVRLGNGATSLELAQRLQRSGANVIFASGYSRDEFGDSRLEAQYLEKPFAEEKLAEAIRRAFGETGGAVMESNEVTASAGPTA